MSTPPRSSHAAQHAPKAKSSHAASVGKKEEVTAITPEGQEGASKFINSDEGKERGM